jgi:hypothetical protein
MLGRILLLDLVISRVLLGITQVEKNRGTKAEKIIENAVMPPGGSSTTAPHFPLVSDGHGQERGASWDRMKLEPVLVWQSSQNLIIMAHRRLSAKSPFPGNGA